MNESPFSKLAPELRNSVYELVMSDDSPVCITITEDGKRVARDVDSSIAHGVALTATCKQMRDECTQLFYACNEFHFTSVEALDTFCEIIGPLNVKVMQSKPVYPFRITYFFGGSGPLEDRRLREALAYMRLTMQQYPLTSAKAWATFRGGDQNVIYDMERLLDVLDLELPWDKEDADLTEAYKDEPKAAWKELIRKVQEALQGYREMLVEV